MGAGNAGGGMRAGAGGMGANVGGMGASAGVMGAGVGVGVGVGANAPSTLHLFQEGCSLGELLVSHGDC